MEKKNSLYRVRSLSVLWALLAILLCAAPCGARTIYSDETLNVGTGYPEQTLNEFLIVLGTLNLYPGAYVNGTINALSGSTLNIYGGELGDNSYINVFSGEPNAVVTVYGTGFEVDNVPLEPLATQFIVDNTNGGELTGTYENGESFELQFYGAITMYLQYTIPDVLIDIKPGGNPNTINLRSKGVLPVAILSSEEVGKEFDATTIDPSTVQLAGAGVAVRGKNNKYMAHKEDVNGDGLTDLVVQIEIKNLNPDKLEDGSAILTAQTSNGVEITGTDKIATLPRGR
ncbi:MAG: hypothetical protein ACYS9C_03750 [Planctomycetota bacterium]|jgi:hypothetical protein